MSVTFSWKNTMSLLTSLQLSVKASPTSRSLLLRKTKLGLPMTMILKTMNLQIQLMRLRRRRIKMKKMMSQESTPQTWAKEWMFSQNQMIISHKIKAHKRCTPSSLSPPWRSASWLLSSPAAVAKRPRNTSTNRPILVMEEPIPQLVTPNNLTASTPVAHRIDYNVFTMKEIIFQQQR